MATVLTEEDVFPWAEARLGGRIIASTRQGGRESGGRPGWFLTLERPAGGTFRAYIRADRGGDFGFVTEYTVQREAKILKLLRAEGIPVPEVLASATQPNAMIQAFVEGMSDFTLVRDPAERDRLAREFAQIMARWHAIPAEKFAAIGMRLPVSRSDFIVQDLEVWERGHFPLLKEPVPLVTFACLWLRRNVPEPPARTVLVQGDAGPGQFIFQDGHIRAIVDWELATFGDPMRDLAHVRARNLWYPTGNLPKWFEYYSEAAGIPLDYGRIRYYSVIAMLTTALALAPVVQHLDPRSEHTEWIAEDIRSKVATTEALAEAMGITLEEPEPPAPNAPRTSQLFGVLEQNLREEQLPHLTDDFRRQRMTMALRLVTHLRNIGEIGREIEALELADMAQLLGRAPRTVLEGQHALDALVRRADPGLDEALTRYFHRHALREEALMRGAMGRAEGARIAAIV
ncbi:MAG: phosphotransferase family protein [Gammaproteobacteria bacterium]|nr:phosphotransferase family protein [Gammaproteobacteria bacterium]